jgi:uncharacterized membrane protein
VWKFATADGAATTEDTLRSLQKQELIRIYDAAVVSWPEGARKPKTSQMNNLVGAGALGGMFWGLRDAVLDKVKQAFEGGFPGGTPQLIHANLSDAQEQALREAFAPEDKA